MKRTRRRHLGKSATELLEEAIHLLRASPPATLAAYYLGAVPFVLGLLYFWADMSRSAFASQRLAEGALAVAALFVWMKFWQAIFARNLRALMLGEAPRTWRFAQYRRVFVTQAALQPSGLFLLPLSAIPVLPFIRILPRWPMTIHRRSDTF
jgi:hypothetical protein